MVPLRQRLGSLESRLGLRTYRDIRVSSGQTWNLRVVTVNPRDVGTWLTQSIQVVGDELVVSGIDRDIPKETIESQEYTIDNVTHRCLWVDDRNPVEWIAYLKPMTT
jgi:hypothetical protein